MMFLPQIAIQLSKPYATWYSMDMLVSIPMLDFSHTFLALSPWPCNLYHIPYMSERRTCKLTWHQYIQPALVCRFGKAQQGALSYYPSLGYVVVCSTLTSHLHILHGVFYFCLLLNPSRGSSISVAAMCSSSFCRIRVRRFSALSRREIQSSIDMLSSERASSCFNNDSCENCARRGECRYMQIRSWRFRRPEERLRRVWRRYSHLSSRL